MEVVPPARIPANTVEPRLRGSVTPKAVGDDGQGPLLIVTTMKTRVSFAPARALHSLAVWPLAFLATFPASAQTQLKEVVVSATRHALALKPSRLDPDALTRPVDARTVVSSSQPATIGLLIGGDAGPIRYTSADWTSLITFMITMHREHGTRWLVANSRRTPNEVSDELTRFATAEAPPIERFLDVRTAGPGTLPGLLAACDAMICTADSSSMISECIWARQRTVAIKPTPFPLDRDERAYRDWLIGDGWCRELALSDLTPAAFQQATSAIRPQASNPLDDLAALLTARIPGLGTARGRT